MKSFPRRHHSGYPGGLRSRTLAEMLDRRPEEVIRLAVRGMLPETLVLGQPFTARAFLAVGAGQGQYLEGDSTLTAEGDSLFRMPTAALLANNDEPPATTGGRGGPANVS